MSSPIVFDRDLMTRLADLARLRFSPSKEPVLRERLARILSAFQTLQDLPEARERPLGESLTLRPDVPGSPMAIAEVLANAPQQAAGSFVVPRVVDA